MHAMARIAGDEYGSRSTGRVGQWCASMELYGGFKGPAISHQHANRVLMKLSCLVRTIGIVQGFFLVRKAQRPNLIFGARFLTMN